MQATTQQKLRQFIEQIERLEEEKRATAGDIRDKYAEAKAHGFDTKTMRTVIMLRRKSRAERQEEEAVLDAYIHALGMADGAPVPAVASAELERWTAAVEAAEAKGAALMIVDHNVWQTSLVRQVLEEKGAKLRPRSAEQPAA